MKDRLLEAIRRIGGLNILVLGDVMLDIYDFCYTAESRPIPSEKPGKRAYKAQQSVKTMGGAGNVAANLASLGAATTLIGLTGNDGHFFILQELADAQHIGHCFVRDRSRPTTTKTRLYIDGEYLLRRDDEASHKVDRETAMTVMSEFLRELPRADAVILSDYNKGIFTREQAQTILEKCAERRIPVVVDFKPPNRCFFAGADIIVPNADEAEALHPGFKAAGDLEREVRLLHGELQAKNIVVTLGERGICGWDGDEFFHAPANSVRVVDAVGCGDTVRVALTLGYVLGLSLREAAILANDAAAVIIQKIGTATLTSEELNSFIADRG